MKKPTKYVNLHAHSNGSIGDAIGLPPDHFKFAEQNGLTAHAITDHGNMNAFSHSYKYYEGLEKSGSPFKVIHGIEAYFIPSIKEWEELRKQIGNEKEELKKQKKATKKSSKDENLIIVSDPIEEKRIEELNEHTENVVILESKEGNEETTVVENEEETKSYKSANPLRTRSHLVLLAKNTTGLNSLFKLTSLSYRDGFYFFPRIDFEMLKANTNGNIIGTSACLGNLHNKVLIKHYIDLNLNSDQYVNSIDKLKNYKFDLIQKELKELTERFVDSFHGKDNFFLELQFNRLPYQQILNYHLIELSKQMGVKLVATADCHYPNPDHWKERIIYKTMSKMTTEKLKEIDPSIIPQQIEELDYELYPKNADQMWGAYQKYCVSEFPSFYPEEYSELICDAIERTHDIAHDAIDKKITFDKSPKLPSLNKLIDQSKLDTLKATGLTEDEISFNELVDLTIAGLEAKNKLNDQKYIDRAMEELDVIRHLNLPRYFLTCSQSLALIGKKMLLGAGRGCFVPNTNVCMPLHKSKKMIKDIKEGDWVYTHDGSVQEVLKLWEFDIDENILELEFDDGTIVSCTKDHKILTKNRGWVTAEELTENDELEKVAF